MGKGYSPACLTVKDSVLIGKRNKQRRKLSTPFFQNLSTGSKKKDCERDNNKEREWEGELECCTNWDALLLG